MIRDYCYVGDVVKANLLSLERGSGDFFNIGTGLETKTLTLYEKIQQVFESIKGTGLETLAAPLRNLARPGDIPRSCLRIEKAVTVLGWRPETVLDQGLRKTMEWRIGQGT